jgi:prefoldin subunit 5
MAEPAAPGWYPDLQIPKIIRWWDGNTWTALAAPVTAPTASTTISAPAPTVGTRPPARIPELVVGPPLSPCHSDGRVVGAHELTAERDQRRHTWSERGVTERDQLWMELVDLNSQIPTMRRQRDQLRTDLLELSSQIPTLSNERDELLADVEPLRAEVTDLRSKQQELRSLQEEINGLRRQRSALDRDWLAEVRGSVPRFRSTGNKYQKFHDS